MNGEITYDFGYFFMNPIKFYLNVPFEEYMPMFGPVTTTVRRENNKLIFDRDLGKGRRSMQTMNFVNKGLSRTLVDEKMDSSLSGIRATTTFQSMMVTPEHNTC